MKFITKNEVQWVKGAATVESLGLHLSGYKGVTKLISFGEPSFEEKMIAQHGEVKAAEIINKSRSRGDSKHSRLETKKGYDELITKEIKEKLGQHLASEVFLYGTLFDTKVLGFADAIFRAPCGKLLVVDYKTKSKPYYQQDLSAYWKQCICYSMLINKMYGLKMPELKMAVVLLYSDGSEPAYYEQALDGYTRLLARDIQEKCHLVNTSTCNR